MQAAERLTWEDREDILEDEEGFVTFDGGSYSRGPIRLSPEPGDMSSAMGPAHIVRHTLSNPLPQASRRQTTADLTSGWHIRHMSACMLQAITASPTCLASSGQLVCMFQQQSCSNPIPSCSNPIPSLGMEACPPLHCLLPFALLKCIGMSQCRKPMG